MTMVNFINNLFLSHGYSLLEYKDKEWAVYSNELRSDFWIIKEADDGILEYQDELVLNLKLGVLSAYPAAGKNMSMLVLWKEPQMSSDLEERIIIVENDPIACKKYVLAYRQTDFENIMDIDPSRYMDILMDSGMFERLKEEVMSEEFGSIHLLYSIAHKLPFLMTAVSHSPLERLKNHYEPSSQKDEDTYNWMNNVMLDNLENQLIEEAGRNEKI